MPIFTKLLCFCAIPAILLGLLAMPSMRSSKEKRGDAWLPLAQAGVDYPAVQSWRVEDPLTAATPGLDVRWSMAWPDRRSVHGAAFFSLAGAQVTVFVGEKSKLEPLAHDALATYAGNVMIERAPAETWTTKDGIELRVERAHYRPGPVGGSDTTMLLAFGGRGRRFVLINAGGEGDDLSPAAVRGLLAQLTLGR